MLRKNLREEVHPWEASVDSAFADNSIFLADGRSHDIEFFARLSILSATDALPDFVCIERTVLVHEESRAFGEEEHSEKKVSEN